MDKKQVVSYVSNDVYKKLREFAYVHELKSISQAVSCLIDYGFEFYAMFKDEIAEKEQENKED